MNKKPTKYPFLCPHCNGKLIVPQDDEGRYSSDLWYCSDCGRTHTADEIDEYRKSQDATERAKLRTPRLL